MADDMAKFAEAMLKNNESNRGLSHSDDKQPGTAPAHKTKHGEAFDIYKVDYPWVDNQTDKRELRLAYEALKQDAGFPDLSQYVLKRLKAVDTKFKTEEDFNKPDPVAEKAATEDVEKFLKEMTHTDAKLRASADDKENE